MPKSILYSSIRSPHCLKVAIFLTEKGIPFDRVEIDLPARQQKTPEFLAINPAGQVPVYVDGEGVHADSLQIMRYLDERYPEPWLFPTEPVLLQPVLDWINLSSGRVRDVSHELYWQLIEPPVDGTDWAVVNALKGEGMAILSKLEVALIGNPFICGGFGAADISLLPWIHGYGRFDLPEAGTMPNVEGWLKRMTARASFGENYQVVGRAFLGVANSG